MLENLLFSLGCVTPYFLLIVVGYGLSRARLVTQDFLKAANRFTFRVALPVNLFLTTANIDWQQDVGVAFLGYILLATAGSFLVIWALTEVVYRRRRELIGTVVQGSFRSNYVLLGRPIAEAVVGTQTAVAKAALTSAMLIPLYNVLSVIILMLRGKGGKKVSPKEVALGVVKNPLIVGTVLGILFSLAHLRLPMVLDTTMGYISQTATPLGLLSIGGIFNWKDATARLKHSIFPVLFKNVLLVVSLLPLSYLLGFRGEELVIILVAFGSPVAVSSYAMASEMGGDPPLAANILILTTFLSAFVMAAGIYCLRALGWL